MRVWDAKTLVSRTSTRRRRRRGNGSEKSGKSGKREILGVSSFPLRRGGSGAHNVAKHPLIYRRIVALPSLSHPDPLLFLFLHYTPDPGSLSANIPMILFTHFSSLIFSVSSILLHPPTHVPPSRGIALNVLARASKTISVFSRLYFHIAKIIGGFSRGVLNFV